MSEAFFAPPAAPAPLPSARVRILRATALVALVLLTLALAVLWGADRAGRSPLDPQGVGPEGSRAVARVLAEHGVEVVIVRSTNELRAFEADADTTLAVTSAKYLGEAAWAELDRFVPEQVLVVADDPVVLADLGLDDAENVSLSPLTARCDPGSGLDQLDGLTLDVPASAVLNSPGCFRHEGARAVATLPDGTQVLGAAAALTNDHVLRGDNAAIALRLLGARDRLVWFVPTDDDLADGESGGAVGLLPQWIAPSLWLVLLAGVALMLWRGRRLGPLAVEPLPVDVKAIETTLGRGRLLRRASDRAYTAAALRAGTVRRLTGDHASTLATQAAEIARRTQRPTEEVLSLLAPDAAAPTDDAALVALARSLAALEKEARHP